MTELESKTLATTLYVSLFRRSPDKGGLDYWTEKLQGGLSLRETIGYFLNSDEGKALYGTNTSAATFVDNLYQNVLNRKTDAGGAEFWQGRLVELGNRNELVEQFITSIKNGSGGDNQLLQNRIEFGLSFAASKSGDNASYAKSLLSSITSDPASLNIAKLVNEALDNPPALTEPPVIPPILPPVIPPILPPIPPILPPVTPGAAPTISLREDTGVSSSDGITKNGVIDITLPLGYQSWEYSTDAGHNWSAGSGTTFVLSEGSYTAGNVLARYVDAVNVTSNAASLASSLIIDQTGPSYHSYTTGAVMAGDFDPELVTQLSISFNETVFTGTTGFIPFYFTGSSGGAGFQNKGVIAGSLTIEAGYSMYGATLNLVLPTGIVLDAAGNSSQALDVSAGVTFATI